jgi:hypothetical protein
MFFNKNAGSAPEFFSAKEQNMERSEITKNAILAKSIAMERLGEYDKALPHFRIKKVKLDEFKFCVRFDLQSYPISSDTILNLGDYVKIDYSFGAMAGNRFFSGDYQITESYKIIAFIEMNSDKHRATLCALYGHVSDSQIYDVVTSNEGITTFCEIKHRPLLLFYPEELMLV